MKSTSEPAQGIVAIVISTIMLIIGVTTVFAELQSDLDRIWRVPAAAKRMGIFIMLGKRLLSFGLVLGLGLMLLVSLLIRAAIAAAGKWWNGFFAG